MAKNAVNDWDTTAANNTDVGGINIAEGCPPSGINNAIRTIMAQIASGVMVKAASGAVSTSGSAATLLTLSRTSAGAASIAVGNTNNTVYFGQTSDASNTFAIGSGAALTGAWFTVSATAATLSGSLTASGAGTFGSLSAPTATVSGAVTAGSVSTATATVSGAITAGSVSAGSATVSGAFTAGSLSTANSVMAGSATISGGVSAGSVSASSGTVSGFMSAGSFATGAAAFSGLVSIGSFSGTGATAGKQVSASTGVLDSSASSTSTTSHLRFYNPNGLVGSIQTSTSATSFNTSSDERLKRDFADFDAGEIIDQIAIYQYQWKVDGSVGYGPKAQELFGVFPAAVSPGNDAEPGGEDFMPWGYDASKLVPLLIREVQSLRQRVTLLEQE